jgi:hypothetical protein
VQTYNVTSNVGWNRSNPEFSHGQNSGVKLRVCAYMYRHTHAHVLEGLIRGNTITVQQIMNDTHYDGGSDL